MDKSYDLKEMISVNIKNYLKSNNENKKNEKYLITDFKEIQVRAFPNSGFILFYNPIYKDVKFF